MTSGRASTAEGIVDAHHHLWVRARHPQDWVDPASMATIDADFEPADLAPLAAAAGVTHTVVVQTIHSESETVELLAIAAASPLVSRVVGWVDLTRADVAAGLDALRRGTSGAHLAGIRHVVQGETDPAFLDRDEIRRGIAAVGAAGLVFDLVIRDHQLPAAIRLARDLPEVSFVLDHLGKPALASGRVDGWMSDLTALARLPNTTAKLSGLVTEADWASWSVEDLRPALSCALDAFGPDRLMFGSDWPVCLLATSYQRWIDVLRELLDEVDENAQASIWRETARRVYGLE